MTDYLEELLEQQEQEEAGSLVEWRKRQVYGVEPRGMARDDRAAGQASVALREAEMPQVQEKAQAAAQLLRQAQRLHCAVRQAGKWGRGGSASPTAVWEAANGGYGLPLASHRAADYAAAVDAAFQRDARRYDGPMELPR